ncbi:uncharacterized protein At1g24485 [Elaeis guineensis]|uniref:uncharacterized protein At1g24485 n=1 Tax=Elaeis guineensis var. tenera TaxID=51953 RepID=UPI003C6D6A13
MKTLARFDSRRKNCYPIGLSGGGRILVRASFYDGNCDGKSSRAAELWAPFSGDRARDCSGTNGCIKLCSAFTEVSSLSSTRKRSFEIYVDGEHSDPIVPPYQDISEYFINGTAKSSTAFTLVATTVSTLPPIISAMEILSLSDVLSNGTNSNDVETLALLQQ